jgi:hypothetical protein
MRKLVAVWNQLNIYSHLDGAEEIVLRLITGKLKLDAIRTLKANIIAEQNYTISIRPYSGVFLPIDVAFCEIVENDIRLFVPEPFGSGFVIFDSGTEIELTEDELVYILNSSLMMAINSIWHGLSAECYLKFLKATTPLE